MRRVGQNAARTEGKAQWRAVVIAAAIETAVSQLLMHINNEGGEANRSGQ